MSHDMATESSQSEIHILRPPRNHRELEKFALVFRDLRLQSLSESPESFTEKYDVVFARPPVYWQDYILNHGGLMHIAFGVPKPWSETITKADPEHRTGLILEHGRPLGMAVNTGPVPQELFTSTPGSQILPNRTDEQEQRFHGGMLFHVADMRGGRQAKLMEHLILDRDRWLLQQLQSTGSEVPPVARFRGNVKPGCNQERLLSFYTRSGWYIAGTQTWRTNLLAEGGLAALRAAEARGDDMEMISVVVEKIFTVPHLEYQIRKNSRMLQRQEARL